MPVFEEDHGRAGVLCCVALSENWPCFCGSICLTLVQCEVGRTSEQYRMQDRGIPASRTVSTSASHGSSVHICSSGWLDFTGLQDSCCMRPAHFCCHSFGVQRPDIPTPGSAPEMVSVSFSSR